MQHPIAALAQQKCLDAREYRVQNEDAMLRITKWYPGTVRSAALTTAAAALALLSSCGGEDEAEKTPAAAEEKPAAAPTPAGDQAEPLPTSVSARDALFDFMVYGAGKVMSNLSAAPELNECVRDMLDKMIAYYDVLREGKLTPERVRLGLRIGEVCRDLGAYPKAKTYYDMAEADFMALPEARRTSTAGLQVLSAIHNGIGTCRYCDGDFAQAREHYEKSLELDKELFNRAVPSGGPLSNDMITPEISRACCDLLGSYRCLGDCLRRANEPDEARDLYQRGCKLAAKLSVLDAPMAISFGRLLTELGDLESATGNPQNALAFWVHAQKILRQANAAASKPELKSETKRMYDALGVAIAQLQRRMPQNSAAQPESDTAGSAADSASSDEAGADSGAAAPAGSSSSSPAAS